MAITTYTKSQLVAKELMSSGVNVLLTGKPGTGKTELLRDICEDYTSQGKKVVVTGTTGMAAANFEGGRTIHNALRWNVNGGDYNYEQCIEILKDADLLIVDEVSMLGSSIGNHLMRCLKELKRPPQLVMSGDFFQFSPVLEKYYPFENPYWSYFDLNPCVLKEVVRQRDSEFIYMLSRAMIGDKTCIQYFNEMSCSHNISGAIYLCTTNEYVAHYNDLNFKNLSGVAKIYTAQGETCRANFRETSVAETLSVKIGMRVMALRNDPSGQYQNGSLGTVREMSQDSIKVQFDNGNVVDMHRIKYFVDCKKDCGTGSVEILQFPLAGGYAITIHKSQGQTFDAVNIKAPNCWASGQLYVALSRARDIKGIYLNEPITADSLKVDPRVIRFYRNLLEKSAA